MPGLIKTAIARYGLITAVVVAELILQDAADVHALRMALCLTFQDKLCISTGIVSLLLLELSEQFQRLTDIRFCWLSADARIFTTFAAAT